ncbi:hypothetical protein L1987_30858 [Smallanthus sonchifolius]|uniref:Uncharacterized protein n=1 Tax=Smallanthus sonchifolius TaxID=185202 RepID=A0ACB9I3S3_9ASTR|nr:hypothetical protein L1987_30858 [Smallanthus sonchifolius]
MANVAKAKPALTSQRSSSNAPGCSSLGLKVKYMPRIRRVDANFCRPCHPNKKIVLGTCIINPNVCREWLMKVEADLEVAKNTIEELKVLSSIENKFIIETEAHVKDMQEDMFVNLRSIELKKAYEETDEAKEALDGREKALREVKKKTEMDTRGHAATSLTVNVVISCLVIEKKWDLRRELPLRRQGSVKETCCDHLEDKLLDRYFGTDQADSLGRQGGTRDNYQYGLEKKHFETHSHFPKGVNETLLDIYEAIDNVEPDILKQIYDLAKMMTKKIQVMTEIREVMVEMMMMMIMEIGKMFR